MFLKREKSETDDFKRKKKINFGSKGKNQKNFNILRKYVEKCFN